MVTTLVADELANGMTGKHAPAREDDTITPLWNEDAVRWFADRPLSTMGFTPPPVVEETAEAEEDTRMKQSPVC